MKKKFKMPFKSPRFHKGLNCTVRLGEEWKNRLKVGDEFVVESPERNWTMEVKRLLVSRLKNLKEKDIKCEHESSCRTLKGLKKEMKAIYPDITKNSVFTVIYFTVKK